MSCEGYKHQQSCLWKRREFAYHRLQSSSYTPLWAICACPSMQGAVHSVKDSLCRKRERYEIWFSCVPVYNQLLTWCTGNASTDGPISGTDTIEMGKRSSCKWNGAMKSCKRLGTQHTPGIAAIFSSIALSNTICLPTDSTPWNKDRLIERKC